MAIGNFLGYREGEVDPPFFASDIIIGKQKLLFGCVVASSEILGFKHVVRFNFIPFNFCFIL